MILINGKDYTELEINKRCAEIIKPEVKGYDFAKVMEKYETWDDVLELGITKNSCVIGYTEQGESITTGGGLDLWSMYDPCNSPHHTWPIIEKVWDELMKLVNKHGDEPKTKNGIFWTRWQHLQEMYNCNKLVAACICLVEVNS